LGGGFDSEIRKQIREQMLRIDELSTFAIHSLHNFVIVAEFFTDLDDRKNSNARWKEFNFLWSAQTTELG
jgi:hypothetical protein